MQRNRDIMGATTPPMPSPARSARNWRSRSRRTRSTLGQRRNAAIEIAYFFKPEEIVAERGGIGNPKRPSFGRLFFASAARQAELLGTRPYGRTVIRDRPSGRCPGSEEFSWNKPPSSANATGFRRPSTRSSTSSFAGPGMRARCSRIWRRLPFRARGALRIPAGREGATSNVKRFALKVHTIALSRSPFTSRSAASR